MNLNHVQMVHYLYLFIGVYLLIVASTIYMETFTYFYFTLKLNSKVYNINTEVSDTSGLKPDVSQF